MTLAIEPDLLFTATGKFKRTKPSKASCMRFPLRSSVTNRKTTKLKRGKEITCLFYMDTQEYIREFNRLNHLKGE